MKKFVKVAVNKTIGAFGDKMNEVACPFILYQPKAYKRGDSLVSIFDIFDIFKWQNDDDIAL